MTKVLCIFWGVVFFASCANNSNDQVQVKGRVSSVREIPAIKVPAENLDTMQKVMADNPLIITDILYEATKLSFPTKVDASPDVVNARLPIPVEPGKNGWELPILRAATDTSFRAGIPDFHDSPIAYTKTYNPHSFKFYTRLQGLPHDDISSLLHDTSGNIWIGTYGGGVSKFSGNKFAQFTEDEGLGSNQVLCMLEDTKGNIWFGTRDAGLTFYDGKRIHIYNQDNSLLNNSIEVLYEDSKGQIWFGTYGGGVGRYNGENFKHFTTNQGLSHNIVYSITEDQQGNMWFGTRGGGVSKYDGTKFYNYTKHHGLSSDIIFSSLTDSDGTLWFGTQEGGLIEFKDHNFHIYSQDNGLLGNDIISLFEDSRKNIWMGTRTEGLVRFDGNYFTYFTEKEGLLNEFITSIIEDENGKIWFGTYGHGLGQYLGDIFTHFSEYQGLYDSFIRGITEDTLGNKWFVSNRGGAFMMTEDSLFNYALQHYGENFFLRSAFRDSRGNLWFGSNGDGVVVFDNNTFYHYTEEQGLSSNFIQSIMEDSHGNIWMGTRDKGAIKYDGTFFSYFTENQGLSDNNVRKIIEDRNGHLWFATRYGGVTQFDGEIFYHLTYQTEVMDDDIYDIVEDSEGVIWMGTNGKGLLRYDGNSIIQFTERDGLINNFIYALLIDSNQNLWIGSRSGISRLLKNNYKKFLNIHDGQDNAAQLDDIVVFKNYTQEEGFLGIGCNSRSMYEDQDGIIWIGANDILTAYHPEGDLPDTIPPKLQLIRLGLFNERIQWHSIKKEKNTWLHLLENGSYKIPFDYDSLAPWYGVPLGLELAHNNNFLNFHYLAIAPNFNKSIRFKYKLQGFNHQWSGLTSRKEVSYGNLLPGSYVFKLKAVNSEGYWSDELQYKFEIKNPWWATWWAYTVYTIVVLIFTLIVWLWILQIRKERKIKSQKEQLLKQEVVIAKQSAEFKQNFLANMSHEIRTPLTGILGMAEILSRTRLDTNQKDYLNTLILSGENLRETINMVLDYSKIEAGKLKIKQEIFPLKELFADAEKLFSALKKENILMEMFIHPDIPEFIISDQRRINQVINNLLSNAVKFTPKGKITLVASLENKDPGNLSIEEEDTITLKIIVKDTGCGISKENQLKLFTPFYQVEQSFDRSFDGTGLGLAISKELVHILGGQIGMDSQEGKGSSFWFTIKATLPQSKDLVSFPPKINYEKKLKKLSVLLVEDKVVNQKVILLMLKSLGHSVTITANGAEALQVFAPGKFDLILMDIQMPVMDGITAMEKLRKRYKNLPPIVGLSANAFEGDREKYMALGMDEYITKPVKQTDFEKTLITLGFFSIKNRTDGNGK